MKRQTEALSGQLEYHFNKIENVKEFNRDLAQRIEDFTNVLAENNFSGVFDVDDDVYHNGIGISQSRFSHLKKSKSNYHYHTYVDLQSNMKRKRHFSEGDFVHRTLLEKGTIAEKFCNEEIAINHARLFKPDAMKIRATKEYKEKIKELQAEGFEPIKADLFSNIHMLETLFKEEPTLAGLMKDSIKEKAIYSICPITGLVRKAKVDILKVYEDTFTYSDLKSTKSIDEDSFNRSVGDYDYHVQCAYYCDIIESVLNKKPNESILVIIEKDLPFEVDARFIERESIEQGREDSIVYLKMLAECYEKRNFPRREITLKACGLTNFQMNKKKISLED